MILSVLLLLALIECSKNVVYLEQGVYVGKNQGRHVRFLGIPYAEKVSRFEPPTPFYPNLLSSYQLINATEWKAACPDFANKKGNNSITKYLLGPRAPESEDCLYAN